MKIQQRCRDINSDIHERMFQSNHFESTFGDYEKCFTSLDVIEDCQDAIDEFLNLPDSNFPRRSVLNIYGVLQATYCQQDGLFSLYQNISRSQCRNLDEFFDRFDFNKEIRNVRNDIVGHPTARKGNTEFYFIDKGPNSKYKFSYAGYTPEFRVVDVNLKTFISQQKSFTELVLSEVDELIKQAMENHKEEHKHKSLFAIISNLNYSIQLIKRGISDSHRSFQAEGGIKIVRQKIAEFISELNLRFNNDIPIGIEITNDSIQYILDKIENWYNTDQLLGNQDAKVFMIAFDSEFSDLIQMAKEVDKEYAT